jgi:NAD(P)-dependent dehydrogenase (short-subunit alcohol dehydrogenase family)
LELAFEVVDVSSFQQITNFAGRYRASGKPLHILVNNAGIFL